MEVFRKTFQLIRDESQQIDASKSKRRGVILVAPKHLSSMERPDPNKEEIAKLKSFWIECNFVSSSKKKQLMKMSFSPQKNLKEPFIEQLSRSIDEVMRKRLPISLIVVYN